MESAVCSTEFILIIRKEYIYASEFTICTPVFLNQIYYDCIFLYIFYLQFFPSRSTTIDCKIIDLSGLTRKPVFD